MSIYKRGSIFYMNFTVNGVRVFKSTGKTTKREAKAVEAAERHKILKQSKQTPQEKGAETLLLDAIDQYSGPHISDNSLKWCLQQKRSRQ